MIIFSPEMKLFGMSFVYFQRHSIFHCLMRKDVMQVTLVNKKLDIYLYVMVSTKKSATIPTCHPALRHRAKGMCNSCYDKWSYYQRKERKTETHRAWAQKNKQHLDEYRKSYFASRKERFPLQVVFNSIKQSSKRRGIHFDLTLEDLEKVWTTTCPVLGIPIKLNSVRQDDSISVDRINNSIGYVPGNICVMSWRANHLKLNATIQELEAVLSFMKSK